MSKKLTKLVGLSKQEFDSRVLNNEGIILRSARLIPMIKPGDEMALTSVFLSSLRLIKEFKRDVLTVLKMPKGGKIFVYTEVSFLEFPNSRIDGLIINVQGGIIKDAALLEMKNKNNDLEIDQIEKYIEIAKFFEIPRLVTVSNQFVSDPSQFPIQIKGSKKVALYHFSWSYLLTLAHILLFKNDNNIEDEDQVEIMREVVLYLEHKISGVCGFTQMKPGWKTVVENINAGSRLKSTDDAVVETVESWHQEERDMALILSRKLGLLVKSGNAKYKNDISSRRDNDINLLLNDRCLNSILKVRGAVSDISIDAQFEKRNIEMVVQVTPPLDKKVKGQLGSIKRQVEKCNKLAPIIFAKIKDSLIIEIVLKRTNKHERIPWDRLDEIYSEVSSKEIKNFKIILIKDFGKNFSSRSKFVSTIEEMLVDFYKGVIQYLENWDKPAPKVVDRSIPVESPDLAIDCSLS